MMGAKETTENFWAVWQNFEWPEIKPVSYRLYYHEDGSPDFYTMEDLPGDYIEVSQEVYINSPRNVRVVDGELQIMPVRKTVQKLIPNQRSGTRCDTRDVCVVVDDGGTFWSRQDYEIG
jgi:hypothetical protein